MYAKEAPVHYFEYIHVYNLANVKSHVVHFMHFKQIISIFKTIRNVSVICSTFRICVYNKTYLINCFK